MQGVVCRRTLASFACTIAIERLWHLPCQRFRVRSVVGGSDGGDGGDGDDDGSE